MMMILKFNKINNCKAIMSKRKAINTYQRE
jgi:hypothetical protein